MSVAMDEIAVIRELCFEANTKYINAAYRSGRAVSAAVVLRCLVGSLVNRSPDSLEKSAAVPGATLAVSMFRNERTAIDEHIAQGTSNWQHVHIDASRGTGVNFAAALLRASLRVPRFVKQVVSSFGREPLRRFAYPYIGFAIYLHLRDVFARQPVKGTIITANMAHPLSLAIHYAALHGGWQTVYLEHAMTPRSIARERGYSRLLVRSPHTRELLVDSGIDRARIDVLDYWRTPERLPGFAGGSVRRVGFAVNDLDDLDSIGQMAEQLVARGIRCEIRVHDSDRRLGLFRQMGARLGVEISSAAGSGIVDYVRRHDLVIVGNSSVLLDCARAGIPAIYFWNGAADMFDYYGLAQYMNYPAARTPHDVLQMLVP